MKLVEILARELVEWPEHTGTNAISQDSNQSMNRLYRGLVVGQADLTLTPCGIWSNRTWTKFSGLQLDVLADDYLTAIVTRANWEAERAKLVVPPIAKPVFKQEAKWIRHRGGKCPVDRDSLVEIRWRDGEIGVKRASMVKWDHGKAEYDIMAYRLAEPVTEKERQVVNIPAGAKIEIAYAPPGEIPPDDGWRVIGTTTSNAISYHAEELIPVTEAKTDQIEGPIKWRDRIHELDAEVAELNAAHTAAVEVREEERVSLVRLLEDEGFALIVRSSGPVEDMSDWRNWKRGDLITYVHVSGSSFTNGKQYKLLYLAGGRATIEADDEGDENGWLIEYFKWHSRP
jgi:hypothetical protein